MTEPDHPSRTADTAAERAIEPAPGDPPEGFAQPTSRLDVGPMLTLPLFRLLAAAWGATAVTGFVAQGVLIALGQNAGPMKAGVWLGALSVALAHLVGLLAMQPWKARRLGRWPFVWLVGRGVSFVAVLAFAAVLYSATRPSPLPFGLVIAAGHFAALIAEVVAYATHVRTAGRPEPSP